MADEGWDADDTHDALSVDETAAGSDVVATNPFDLIDWGGSMLRYKSLKDVVGLLRSAKLKRLMQRLADFNSQQEKMKNAITKDDPEFGFLGECSEAVLEFEVEKSKVFKFLRDHFAVRFPELSLFVSDGVTFGKIVEILPRDLNLEDATDALDELLPSQLVAVVIAAASTTQGRELDDDEYRSVQDAARELRMLELGKQTLLEYIQIRMPLVCPNLCAFLGAGLTSQLFAITSSITKIATMDPSDVAKLGSYRGSHSGGIAIKTVGFLMNSDLVANHPPQLRPKALRLVANAVVNLARIDDNRRASDNSFGLKQREEVRRKMISWTDPIGLRGAGNNTYERKNRKRPR